MHMQFVLFLPLTILFQLRLSHGHLHLVPFCQHIHILSNIAHFLQERNGVAAAGLSPMLFNLFLERMMESIEDLDEIGISCKSTNMTKAMIKGRVEDNRGKRKTRQVMER